MSQSFRDELESRLKDSLASITSSNSDLIAPKLEALTMQIKSAFDSGNKVFIFGNGGSAAEATHIAAEFTGHCVLDHKPWPVLSLNDSVSALTAISNDYGLDQVFLRQIEAFGKKGDVAIGLSTSGTSPNVRSALDFAAEIGIYTSLWTCNRLKEDINYDIVLKAGTSSTPRAQEAHLFWGHVISEYLEIVQS